MGSVNPAEDGRITPLPTNRAIGSSSEKSTSNDLPALRRAPSALLIPVETVSECFSNQRSRP